MRYSVQQGQQKVPPNLTRDPAASGIAKQHCIPSLHYNSLLPSKFRSSEAAELSIPCRAIGLHGRLELETP